MMLKILWMFRRMTWGYLNCRHPVGFRIINDIDERLLDLIDNIERKTAM